ncbi:MAG: response regulator transcription factor [Caldicoprobacterales bacterium]
MHRILIVDDEELIVRSLSGYIAEHFNFEIHKAYSSFEAIEKLRKMRFDIVITDISMPVMNGIELLDFIKSYWPECRVIILTAYNDFQYAYNTLKYDNVDFFLKIESFDMIGKSIEQFLHHMESEQNKERLYIEMGKRISLMSPYLRTQLLDRLLRGEEPLPEQEELDMLELPLSRKHPILLVIGLIDGDPSAKTNRQMSEILEYVERKLSLRNIHAVFHNFQSYMVWFIQQDKSAEEQPLDDLAAYVYETISVLPEGVMKSMKRTLTLVIDKSFVEWNQLHLSYKSGTLSLERLRGESGVQKLNRVPESIPADIRQYPGIEELSSLWNLIKQENRESFINTLNKELAFLKKVDNIKATLPLSAVSAIECLLLEAIYFFGFNPSEYMEYYRKIMNQDIISGSYWLDGCLHLFDRVFEQRIVTQKQRFSDLIKQINNYIRIHFAEDISITQIAEMVSYNPSYLSRKYKEYTGTTLMDYIIDTRIRHAKELLSKSSKQINEIAALCGFNSAKYFNQAFKNAVGLSPKSFREEIVKMKG